MRDWLESMAVHHRYSREEIAQATGLAPEAIARALQESHLTAEEVKTRLATATPRDRILVLPYPGGRHPRIGFLDGAIDPRRDTKASVFLPWPDAGYAVVDVPEALWSNLGLTFLAHTHIPTIWDKQSVKLPPGEWTVRPDGTLENAWVLPNQLAIRARIVPRRDVVDMELTLKNGTPEKLTGLRTQICLMLKGAPDFNEQTKENKVVVGRTIATRSRDGKRWIATVWQLARPWDNPPCPCMHSDPTFPDLEPGAESTLRGRIFFHEGPDILEEIARRERAGTLDPSAPRPEAELLSVKKIWDAAPHNAFTDLVRFRDAWYCCFREGEGHVSPDGTIRILTSTDGETWTSAARIASDTGDLRDPKLTVTPDGRLHLLTAAAVNKPPPRHQTLVWLSMDGQAWEGPTAVGEPDVWLWRVTWHEGTAYGYGYPTTAAGWVDYYRTTDGRKFEKLSTYRPPNQEPNESSIVVLPDGAALCLLRRDDAAGSGQLLTASSPNGRWAARDLGPRIGGPHLIRIPDGRLVAAVRLYEPTVRTSLCWLDARTARLREFLSLPSGGDTSYAGLVHHDGLLWVSYYSSHDGKTSIYLAKVKVAPLQDEPFGAEFRPRFIQGTDAENDVRAVAVDARGRVWAATRDGLRRVGDGKLHALEGDAGNGPAYDVAIDANGVVWAGLWNGIVRIADGAPPALARAGGPITVVAPLGERLVAAGPDGAIELSGEEWKPVPGPWPRNIRAFAVNHEGLFVATGWGLYRGEEKLSDPDLMPASDDVRALGTWPQGSEVWIGTAAGMSMYRPAMWSFAAVRPVSGFPCSDVRAVNVSSHGRVVAGTALGVAWPAGRHRDRWSLRHGPRWLPSDDVRDVAVGPDGAVWAATAAGIGVLRSRGMTLADKAEHYLAICRARHVRPPGIVEHCALRVPGDVSTWQPLDDDNDGSYTGLYVAAECYRYAVTKAPDAKANAIASFRALELLHDVTGTKGFLARTVVPADWTSYADPNRSYTPQEMAEARAEDPRWKHVPVRWRKSADGQWLWKGDTSSDEITGHFYTYAVYHDLIDEPDEKARAARLAKRLMDSIIDGGYTLRDLDGEPTRWGVWSPEKLNGDPNWQLDRGVNSVELLSFLTVARELTGDERYEREIRKLLDDHGYGENIRRPQRAEPAVFTYIDTELLALAFPALLRYEKDAARRRLYLESIESWYALCRDDHSPLYAFIFAAATGRDVPLEECIDFLRDAPLDLVEWTVDSRQRGDVKLVHRPSGETLQTDRFLPPSERAVMRWDRNPREAVRGNGGRTESCGTYWLLPYWMGRHHGLVGAP